MTECVDIVDANANEGTNVTLKKVSHFEARLNRMKAMAKAMEAAQNVVDAGETAPIVEAPLPPPPSPQPKSDLLASFELWCETSVPEDEPSSTPSPLLSFSESIFAELPAPAAEEQSLSDESSSDDVVVIISQASPPSVRKVRVRGGNRELRALSETPKATKAQKRKQDEQVETCDAINATACQHCSYVARIDSWTMRSGLVHTLQHYADMFVDIWAVQQLCLKQPRVNSHIDTSRAMLELREVLEKNGIGWDERCRGLILPFDRSHRGTDDLSRRGLFGDLEKIVAPHVDQNTAELLYTQFFKLAAPHRSNELTHLLTFFNKVVLTTVVYLHERWARFADCTLASLEAEFDAKRKRDTGYKYVAKYGVSKALEQCESFAALYAKSSSEMRFGATGASLAVQELCETIENDDDLEVDNIDIYLCNEMHKLGSRSAFDYIWPEDIDCTSKLGTYVDSAGTTCLVTLIEPSLPGLTVPPPPLSTNSFCSNQLQTIFAPSIFASPTPPPALETITYTPPTTSGRNKRTALDFTMTQIAQTIELDDLLSMANPDLSDLFGSMACNPKPFFGIEDGLEDLEPLLSQVDAF